LNLNTNYIYIKYEKKLHDLKKIVYLFLLKCDSLLLFLMEEIRFKKSSRNRKKGNFIKENTIIGCGIY